MSLHKEISFEDEICNHLAAQGWLYEVGDAAHYDRTRSLRCDGQTHVVIPKHI